MQTKLKHDSLREAGNDALLWSLQTEEAGEGGGISVFVSLHLTSAFTSLRLSL